MYAFTPYEGSNTNTPKAVVRGRYASQRTSKVALTILQHTHLPQAAVAPATIGSTVCLRYGKEIQCYTLVSSEATTTDAQSLAIDSPLGESVLGKYAGDIANVHTAYGQFQFIICSVE
jgi:transcription elongation GreA/GreB family factor